MAFFEKLKFWKKKEEFGTEAGKDKLGLHPETGLPPSFEQAQYPTGLGDFGVGLGEQPAGQDYGQQWKPQQQYPQYGQRPAQNTSTAQQGYAYPSEAVVQPSQGGSIHEKNMEVISLKLDTLRSSLDSVNQRLVNIEQMLRSRRSW